MSAPTPGPWSICRDPIGLGKQMIAEVFDGVGSVYILSRHDRASHEAPANARQLAAAPDMLAALELARLALTQFPADLRTVKQSAALKAVRAAIAATRERAA